MEEKINNIKMIKTDPNTLLLLTKIKGTYFQKGIKTSNSAIIKKLIEKEAKKLGLLLDAAKITPS